MKLWRNNTSKVLRDEIIDGSPVQFWAPGDEKFIPDHCDAEALGLRLTPLSEPDSDVYSTGGHRGKADGGSSTKGTRRRPRSNARRSKSG